MAQGLPGGGRVELVQGRPGARCLGSGVRAPTRRGPAAHLRGRPPGRCRPLRERAGGRPCTEDVRAILAGCVLLTVGCAALVAGTSASPAPSPSAATWTLNPGHVFRASPGMLEGGKPCPDEAAVEQTLREFAAAFNGGDANAIRANLSTAFWGVFMNVPGRSEAAYTRDDAVRYLVERSRAGDRLAFGRPQVNGLEAWDGAAHFGTVPITLRRGGTSIELQGRGALYCAGSSRGIRILSVWK